MAFEINILKAEASFQFRFVIIQKAGLNCQPKAWVDVGIVGGGFEYAWNMEYFGATQSKAQFVHPFHLFKSKKGW